jgi:glucose-6-phosphate dehydrogenase assembly protein OpcA
MTTSQQQAAKKKQSTTAFLSGRLAHVDIAKIERELKELWQQVGEKEVATGQSVTRACAINLVMYCEDDDAETAASTLLDEITINHPCRAILAICRPAKEPNLEAWVSARCHITDAKNRKQICCEQITVRAEGTGQDTLASVVLPLLVSDLPVILWWQAAGMNRKLLAPFLPAIDKLVVDSSLETGHLNLFNELKDLRENAKKLGCHSRFGVSDLSWRRIMPWREALAMSFDRETGAQPAAALSSLERLEVCYADDAKPSKDQPVIRSGVLHQSVLLLGWMAERLSWTAQSMVKSKDASLNVQFNNGKVSATFMPLPRTDVRAGNICSVAMHLGAPYNTVVRAELLEGKSDIIVTSGSSEQAGSAAASEQSRKLHFKITERSQRDLIDDELQDMSADPVFERAIAHLLSMSEIVPPHVRTPGG